MLDNANFKITPNNHCRYSNDGALARFVRIISGDDSSPVVWQIGDQRYRGRDPDIKRMLRRLNEQRINASICYNDRLSDNQMVRCRRFLSVCGDQMALNEAEFHARPDFIVLISETYWIAYWQVSVGIGSDPDEYTKLLRRWKNHYGQNPGGFDYPPGCSPVPGLTYFPPMQSECPTGISLLETRAPMGSADFPRSLSELTAGLAETRIWHRQPATLEATVTAELQVTDDPALFKSRKTAELNSISGDDWLVESIVPNKNVCMIYGPPGSLKTFIAMDLALCVSRGEEWAKSHALCLPGFRSKRPLSVAYLIGEGATGLNKRKKAWETLNRPTSADDVLWVLDMPQFSNATDVAKLIATIRKKLFSVDIVIVDTMMRAASGLNLSLPSDSQTFIDSCDKIVRELNCSVVLIHHTGKDLERGPLGAENIKAAVHSLDKVEIVSPRHMSKIVRIRNEKSKESDLRPDIYMAAREIELGDGPQKATSLALERVLEPCRKEAKTVEADPASDIIEILSKTPERSYTAKELAALRIQLRTPEREKIGDLEIDIERKVVTRLARDMPLAQFATREGSGRTAPFKFKYSAAK